MTWEIRQGQVLDRLREMPDESVHCCVTSPPYWGLRDYGVDGQLGLEETPEQFVAGMVEVFGEVRRVLRADGTLWLNIGDSYAHRADASRGATNRADRAVAMAPKTDGVPPGLKNKDLVGIPWRLATALREPRYTGTIKDERDRIWLAAMIDAEGCIYVHRRKAGQSNGQGYRRKADSFGSGLEVSNTNERIVQRCMEITGRGSISRQEKGRRQPLYRWNLRTNESRDVLREVYPHLVAKQDEARLSIGVPSSGEDAVAAWEGLKILHSGGLTDVDFAEPASMFEQGWYLRRDVIWNKLNPMPESVTDRPTSAHEYLFLLTKSPRYFYDAEAIREKATYAGPNGAQKSPHAQGFARRSADEERERQDKQRGHGRRHDGFNDHWDAMSKEEQQALGRNKRSVWTIATKPFSDAHFATFPPDLVEPCIRAGTSPRVCGECDSPWRRIIEASGGTIGTSWHGHANDLGHGQKGGTAARRGLATYRRKTTGWEPTCDHADDSGRAIILDPFAGAATTLLVAEQLGRDSFGIELNPEYVELGEDRIRRWEADPAGHLRRAEEIKGQSSIFDLQSEPEQEMADVR